MVYKRHFFHAPGFDPYDPASQHRRFVRETGRFQATWNVSAAVSELRDPSAGEGHWTVTTAAPGWKVETSYEILDWHDIVRADLDSSGTSRLWNGLVTFVDFIVSGAVRRYFAANWRYAMFFFVPFVDVILFAAVAIAAGWIAGALLGYSALGGAAALAIAVLSFGLLMRWPGERWRVGHGLADWVFARDYMLRRRPDVEARVEAFADRLLARVRRGGVDEIIIAGHSLGATIVIDMLARALARDPDLGRHGPKLGVLTIGATIPKLALHPGGGWVREAARRVAAEPSLPWAEFQARDDVISFHKFHPVQLTRFNDVNDASPPVIRRVQIHEMLSEAALRRYRFDFMRLHYQFVMANERRALYDYFMLICGPAPFWKTVNEPNGPDDLYAADGSLRDPAVVD
jgi:pimeloyl-ACP methyl ester carboxylesterase